MRFLLTDEQREFARSLDTMLSAADTPAAVRAWAGGDHAPGRALWSRLADAGVFALAVPEEHEGVGPLPVELAVAYTALGRHAVPGPVVETAAAAVLLAALGDAGLALAKERLPSLASGRRVASLGLGAYALDADSADALFVVRGDELRLTAEPGPPRASTDPARRMFSPSDGGELLASGPAVREAAARATDWAAFLTAAQSLGVGEALLAQTVAYVKQRTQFGAPIGSFQAVKHRLADTLIGLEFARPLLHGAALALGAGSPRAGAQVAAAKVAAGEAAYAAARAALQLHGALGYTQELDLSLWLRKARPLRDAWGTPSECRRRVLAD
ncbi:acyl-CoA dehydrogenase family protein [Streptomyces sp. H27-C3]|uniref:acyl-CoA dehydrogenase family protein n=1 Tax=Streptomyces sp. H27-C3 TaxID=3046305 RepID=UPI0024B8CC04|nr:acyl-CoA dehydrogenase family protein [Streptomyces sp. H27-C3]MDJ0461250.1 acyl-CoA dehydrogenase family protein [Streptomyces sp. H27-C3]